MSTPRKGKSTKSKAKPLPRSQAPKATGRPPVAVDEDLLRRLAGINCTYEEMASVLDVDARTLRRRFVTVIEKARDSGRAGLRRAQWQAALGREVEAEVEEIDATATTPARRITRRRYVPPNPTMQIWLGKQELGQKDVSRFQHEDPDGKPLPPTKVVVTFVDAPPPGARRRRS